jgi:hypothetical protein
VGRSYDIIVVVDQRWRRLVWIPRDVWCDAIGHRINRAFAVGGHQSLMDGLAHIGFFVNQSICLRRRAIELAFEDVEIRVRVRKHLKLWYPLSPTAPIEGGRKPADFVPPFEILDGERLHQWIGARYARDGGVGTHFDRIRRQQLLLRALLKMGFAFSRVLRDPPWLLCQASELSRTHIWFADGGTSLALDNLKIGQLPAWKCLWFDLDVYILERAGDHKELRDFVGQPVAINLELLPSGSRK